MREPNEIDFWRGLALVTIFIDHVPGLVFENYTLHNFVISDAAEIFVFLAGWSMRLLVSGRSMREMDGLHVFLRLEGRALSIFAAQIVITEIALAITAGGSLLLENPLLLEWNNAAAVFQNPVEAHVGLVLLSHQLGYFNILPLYVVLMAFAPIVVLCDRYAPWALLPASLAIYAGTLASGVNIPTWPVEGRWFFNPLAWQMNFVLGFVLASPKGFGGFARQNRTAMRWLGAPFVLAGATAALLHWSPDPSSLPEPKLFLMFSKTYASPPRIIQLLSLVAVFGGYFKLFEKWISPATGFFSMLGRNSLNVFCIGSLLALTGQFVRFQFGGGLGIDTAVLLVGCSCMCATAWLSEWREWARK